MKKIIAIFLVLTFLSSNMTFCCGAQNKEYQIQLQNKSTSAFTQEEIKKIIAAHYDDILKIIKKEKSEISYSSIEPACNDYREYDNERIPAEDEERGRTVLPLCDGDYAVWNTKSKYRSVFRRMQYAAEYHEDGKLFGIIKIKRIKKDKYAFYEYRFKGAKKSLRDDTLCLKHVLVYYNSENPVTFVATANGTIRAISYKDEIVQTDLENLVDIDSLDLHYVGSLGGDVARAAKQGAMAVGHVTAYLAILPLALIIMPFAFFNPSNYE